MSSTKKRIIIGNWKMNFDYYDSNNFLKYFSKNIKSKKFTNVDFGVAINFLNLYEASKENFDFIISSQNCNSNNNGAFTGEVSVSMLKSINIKHCIIGHSERRKYYNEDNASVNKKLIKLLENNINPILCVGENLEEYENNMTNSVVKKQLTECLKDVKNPKNIIIAYEPIWAIGTGKTATPEIANNVAKLIRTFLENLYSQDISKTIRIQYGGSVNEKNVEIILREEFIDGCLIGGASLDPDTFIKIIEKSNSI